MFHGHRIVAILITVGHADGFEYSERMTPVRHLFTPARHLFLCKFNHSLILVCCLYVPLHHYMDRNSCRKVTCAIDIRHEIRKPFVL